MRYKTKELLKLEKSRWSLFTDDLDTCMFCGGIATELNEIFRGRTRRNSMKYGAVQPLCHRCHTKITDNVELETKWKVKGQEKVMEYFKMTTEEFIEIFGKNYI